MNQIKVLFVEPRGGFIRLDRCMQSIDSWGGVYRFPLNLCRIAGHLSSLGYNVRFIDLQADKNANLAQTLSGFKPDICILSCGYPSMRHDADTAGKIKLLAPGTHVSTFGVAPTALKESFFYEDTWQFEIPFDSIIVGGEPAIGYEKLLENPLACNEAQIIKGEMEKQKTIDTLSGRKLFNNLLYRSPFTGEVQSYVEGSYGCPHTCNFCVVNQLYNGSFAKRKPQDIVNEIIYTIENYGVKQISLWDEGTTFQRSQIQVLCSLLVDMKRSKIPAFKNFTWNTRSTTNLLNEETVYLMKKSGLTGLTLGLESFDASVLAATGKGTTVDNNNRAIKLLKSAGIISIGHIPLGFPLETRESAELTIKSAISSGLDIAQFYCGVPYPATELWHQAKSLNLIRVSDLTKYELCNPIMDTISGITYQEIGEMRKNAMHRFYNRRKLNLKMLMSNQFANWSNR